MLWWDGAEGFVEGGKAVVFKPDYGMSMINRGYRPGLRLVWSELGAYNIDSVDTGKYCTTLDVENIHADHQFCCMTIDMDRERLVELLRVARPEVANDVVRRLNSGERRIDLEEGIRFMLDGELGHPTQGLHETFAPIVARRIGPSERIVVSEK